MDNGLRVCRKCLPERKTEEEFFIDLAKYIQQMDEDVKVDQQTYESRLLLCGSCNNLISGMCRLCGCYVELRAAQKVRRCPDIPAKWEKVKTDIENQ